MNIRRWCFVIMPFCKSLNPVFETVKDTLRDLGHGCRRADLNKTSGNLLDLIVSDIENADLIVADTTDHNPNVFYEVGVAHHVHGPKRLILLHPARTEMPADLDGLKRLEYDPANLAALRTELKKWVFTALDDPFPDNCGMWPNPELRTQEIVRACERFDLRGSEPVIRSMAGVASVAISDHEPPDESSGLTTYQELLLEERDSLLKLLDQGATMKLILCPPRLRDPGKPWERLAIRLHRLLGLLEGKSDAELPEGRRLDSLIATNCEVTISNIPRPNTLILGKRKCFEALRRGLQRGFQTTYWSTTAEEIEQIVQSFDEIFDDCWRTYPDNQAAIVELKNALKEYRISVGDEWDDDRLPKLS